MFNIFGKTTENYEHILCDQLEETLNKSNGKNDFEIIDVRTPGEFHSGHIRDAKLFNLMDPAFTKKIHQLDPDRTYYVYCRSGSRSMTACRVMAEAGFKNLYNVKFGLMGWQGELV
ncbi:MAG: rhodanese-like domain-containing protein [Cyclobacteriaceae bacterium]|jgi:rhodanese-related sulfurtransferase|nr:rhodanese-like domain-containing protein [Cyclobacteriaceae bacterium]